jgi:hypothetical protein
MVVKEPYLDISPDKQKKDVIRRLAWRDNPTWSPKSRPAVPIVRFPAPRPGPGN